MHVDVQIKQEIKKLAYNFWVHLVAMVLLEISSYLLSA